MKIPHKELQKYDEVQYQNSQTTNIQPFIDNIQSYNSEKSNLNKNIELEELKQQLRQQ
jgi:hypothetical protein